MDNNITTNAVKVYDSFYRFTTKEMKKALMQGVRASANELKKSAKQNLRKAVKNSNKRNPKYNDTLQQGVRNSKVVEKNGEIYCFVLITSNRKTGSGSFRLHMLEAGSFRVGTRYAKTWRGKPLKKKRNLGVLKPTYFYKTAETSFNSQYTNIMNSNINKAVDKINQKKFGR